MGIGVEFKSARVERRSAGAGVQLLELEQIDGTVVKNC